MTTTKKYFNSKGVSVTLGREVGNGGEAFVFEVPNLSNQVAKIYKDKKTSLDKHPSSDKQTKLSYMVTLPDAHDSSFLNYVAWPQETLHSSEDGSIASIVGFLMPKVSNKDLIHNVYGPGNRKAKYPEADFGFLLSVARNVAASVDFVHSRGYVIGDVNQSNFLVGQDTKVVLIDSDSFQINASGTMHLCGVGRPEFTPPELQGLSYKDFNRSQNHDNFGLAVLIFHLLLVGWHPFAGRSLKKEAGEGIGDIKNFCYAYARDSQSRGVMPPPLNMIPISILPDAVELMFHRAFTEIGASGLRPTGREWVAALDGIKSRLKKCIASKRHVFPDHLSSCPWCAADKKGVSYFVDLGVTYTATPTGFVLSRVWAQIEQVPAPSMPYVPMPQNFSVTPKELPATIPSIKTVRGWLVCAVVGLIIALPNYWGIIIFLGWFGWWMAEGTGSDEKRAERKSRQDVLDRTQWEYDRVVASLKKCGPEGFSAKRNVFVSLRNEYINLGHAETAALNDLRASAHKRQLKQFLERQSIAQSDIKELGDSRKAILRSAGIKTAADIERHRILQIKGFGEHLTSVLVNWRKDCEGYFRFDPNQAISDSERAQVRSRFAAKKVSIESQLSKGASELERFSKESAINLVDLNNQAQCAAQKLAQAQADLTVF